MKYVHMILIIALALVSIAAGFAKVSHMPQEVAFFEQSGLGTGILMAFGVFQILGGLFSILLKTRKWGLAVVAAMFLLSAIQIFLTENLIFGFLSMIPAVMALLLMRNQVKES